MRSDSTTAARIRALEEKLLQPGVRRSAAELDALLADDFREFGSSGRTYRKREVVELLPVEDEQRFEVDDFQARTLAPGLVLATYRVVRHAVAARGEPHHSLRSSIWKHESGRWQMIFHQGTPIPSSDAFGARDPE